ncbi:MAG: polyprenyl synthetase family protein [Myxococcales bacterium]|nr:polyprenyl synthetase family protein [Myxococcales bacterium]
MTKLLDTDDIVPSARRQSFELSTTFGKWISLADSSKLSPGLWDRALAGPAHAFLVRQGKGVRRTLVNAVYQMCAGEGSRCSKDVLAIVELIHAASLVVDDIEDESSQRRGGPTLHSQYGIPVALNTGCAFYFAALDMLGHLDWPSETLIQAIRAVHRCLVVGHRGQALDLTVRVWDLRPTEIPLVVQEVTEKKTAALMAVCAQLGAMDARAVIPQVQAASKLGYSLGMLLQMLDDLGSFLRSERRDKGIEDLHHGRPVWPWAWLCEVVDEKFLVDLLQRARNSSVTEDLQQIISEIASEIACVGRQAITQLKVSALETAEKELGPSPALASLWKLVDSMESSYV